MVESTRLKLAVLSLGGAQMAYEFSVLYAIGDKAFGLMMSFLAIQSVIVAGISFAVWRWK